MADQKITWEFLRGFAKNCQVHKGSRSIIITSKDDQVLRDIQTFLTLRKFRCNISNYGALYCLRVSSVESLKMWRDKIGFPKDEKKAKMLDYLIEPVREPKYPF